MRTHQPHGDLCVVCKHYYDVNCKYLDFESMRPLETYDDGIVAVRCTKFEREKTNDKSNY